jgi:hypothetical protein
MDNEKSIFKRKLKEYIDRKDEIREKVKRQANDPEVIAYYKQQAKESGNECLEVYDKYK